MLHARLKAPDLDPININLPVKDSTVDLYDVPL